MDESPTPATMPSLRRPISLIASNLETLRDFVQVLDSLLSENANAVIRKHASALLPILVAFAKAKELAPGLSLPTPPGEELARIRERFPDADRARVTERPGGGFTIEVELTKGTKNFPEAVKEVVQGGRRSRLLYSSALLNLATSVELFFARLLHEFFARHPDAIGQKEKVFSIEDLSAFDTLQAAREHYVLSRIEDLLRGSLADWFDFARTRLKLTMGYLKEDLGVLEETFQRRNVIVHNGGLANSIYLSKTQPDVRIGVAIGDDLTPDREYLNKRIDLWERACILIAAELWKQLEPADADRCSALNEVIYSHLVAERWDLAGSIAQFVLKDKQMPESGVETARLNYWQSLKWAGRWADAESEVKDADFSAKSLRFQVPRLALLGDVEEFLPLAQKALETQELAPDEFRDWPIFKELRKDVRFRPLTRRPRKRAKSRSLKQGGHHASPDTTNDRAD